MTWERQPAVAEYRACLCCPPKGERLPMSAILGVGFGFVTVSRDEDEVWCGDSETETLDRFEALAAQDPDHDWRVEFLGPMRILEYQRHDIGKWILVRAEQGFA